MKQSGQKGSILVTILAVTLFLTMLLMGLVVIASANLQRARGRIMQLQAQYAAESGADFAIAKLNDSCAASVDVACPSTNGTEVTVLDGKQYRSTFATTVAEGVDNKEKIITSTGFVYAPKSATTPKHTRKIRIVARRTSAQTASSILSRTIIDIASGVKNIYAKEVYVNDYILLQKNGNVFVAEKVTVAGKDTTANQCSIGGVGVLQKPSDLPAGTKAVYNLAYNNCITPPGNSSSADFEINANKTDLHTIQSMRIPWNQYMDGSYQNAVAGNCTDWTSGVSPRLIPRIGNDKKTHYPDSGTNISSSCGTSGSVALGDGITYTIRNHAHIRANLCAASACNPIFNNPDAADMKFVFVEGTINFDSLRTTPGSGPIVFVTYGADPASKTGACPHGGSLYLGKSNTETLAPKAYLLATYGLCIYQTKFSTTQDALGGIAGKSIYVSSNSGNPWSLRLDPTFPVEQIPIDLSWRQTGYQRL